MQLWEHVFVQNPNDLNNAFVTNPVKNQMATLRKLSVTGLNMITGCTHS